MGLKNVFYNPKGFYVFKFDNACSKNEVLQGSSIQMGGIFLFLKPWMEGNFFVKQSIKSIPTWIKFYDIPHSYWTMDGLSYVASAIGNPITFDKPNALLDPTKFARIYVDILVEALKFTTVIVPVLCDEDGSIMQVRVTVEYPMAPPSCSKCKIFGHSLARCPLNSETPAIDSSTNAKYSTNAKREASRSAKPMKNTHTRFPSTESSPLASLGSPQSATDPKMDLITGINVPLDFASPVQQEEFLKIAAFTDTSTVLEPNDLVINDSECPDLTDITDTDTVIITQKPVLGNVLEGDQGTEPLEEGGFIPVARRKNGQFTKSKAARKTKKRR